jgi:hypothetical protein
MAVEVFVSLDERGQLGVDGLLELSRSLGDGQIAENAGNQKK